MAGEDGDKTVDLIGPLGADPGTAEFFQLVRLLVRASLARGVAHASVGRGERLEEEPVRFRAAMGMRYPSTEIAAAKPARAGGRWS